ncbi:MAG TPA: glycoside hydrolase family 31 protein [bacterium]|nr:glycoside hydrolase family 31 protein [bacterium]
MKSLARIGFFLMIICLPAAAAMVPGDVVSAGTDDGGLALETGGAKINIRFLSQGVVRVEVIADGVESDMATYMTMPDGLAPVAFTHLAADAAASAETVKVRYSTRPFGLAFYGRDDKPLLRLADRGLSWNADGSYLLVFQDGPGEGYYGLGEMFAGNSFLMKAMSFITAYFTPPLHLDQSGQRRLVFNSHVVAPSKLTLPFVFSPEGWGLLIENPARAEFDFTRRSGFSYRAQGGPLRFYVFTGSPYEILDAYSRLTGRTPIPPRWVTGYMQSRYGYKDEAEFRFLMDNFRSRSLPCDALIFDLDWFSSGDDCENLTMGNLTWAPSRYPDPSAFLAEMESRGFKAITIIEPHIRASSVNHQEVLEQGLAAADQEGRPYLFSHWGCSGTLLLDYLNPRTREWWGQKVKAIHDTGVDAWWTDLNEPEDDRPGMYFGGVPRNRAHNLQALLQHRAMAEMYAKELPDERLFILSRSGFVGDWRYGAGIWSGDVDASWGHLARQVPVGLSAGLSGYGLWNSDVGGFGGTPSTELFIRWMEFGAFCPIFRAHGAHSIREPWAFGPEAETILREILNLRYRLAPYLYTLFHELHEQGKPVMRAMMLEFPDDVKARVANDQYMYGPWLLVAPVTTKGARGRKVYIPAGEWTDFWTGEIHRGPARIRVAAPLDRIPLLVREGAVLPMAPVRQFIGRPAFDPLILHVFPGASPSSCRLYDDDGSSRRYLAGESSLTPVLVVPAQKLTIKLGPRQGNFAGMADKPGYVIIIHNQDRPASVLLNGAPLAETQVDEERPAAAGFSYDPSPRLLKISAPAQAPEAVMEIIR